MDLDKATKHKAFSLTKEANGLQFELIMEVLPSNNLKIVKAISFKLYICVTSFSHKKWLRISTKIKHLVSGGQVLSIFLTQELSY